MTMFTILRTRFSILSLLAASICNTVPCGASEISGFLEPYQDVDLAGSEMGVLHYLNVKEGDRVACGQVIGGLDEAILHAALEVARRAKDARGRLNSAEADLALKAERVVKLSELLHRRHASVQEQSRAETQKQVAEAQVRAVREDLAVKTAEFARIEAQLKQKRIVAPIDGIVSQISKDPGEFISASDPVVVKIVQLDVLRAEFPVPASEAKKFIVGKTVTLIVGRQRTNTEGMVEFVSPTTDSQSNTVRVKIRIDNKHSRLNCGERVWLHIDSSTSEDSNEPSRFTTTKRKRSTPVQ